MSDPTLSEEQKMAVGKWLEPLKKFMQQKEGKEFFANRESRTKRYAEALAPDKIDKLTEAELSDLIGDLWANEMWSDKSQPLSRMLTGMSFDQFKQELKRLLW